MNRQSGCERGRNLRARPAPRNARIAGGQWAIFCASNIIDAARLDRGAHRSVCVGGGMDGPVKPGRTDRILENLFYFCSVLWESFPLAPACGRRSLNSWICWLFAQVLLRSGHSMMLCHRRRVEERKAN
jgi:hypothetical protein